MTGTRYLRFADRAAFDATLPPAVDGTPVLPAGVQALQVLGTLYHGGEWAADGTPTTPAAPLPGWHVNVLGDLPPAWQPCEVHPSTPRCIFGGAAC